MAYIARRILNLLPTLFVSSLLVFSMVRLLPGDPVFSLLPLEPTQEQILAMQERLGLNQPFFTQYFDWMGGIFRGDFGTSIVRSLPITPMIATAGLVTLQLSLAALLLGLVIAIPYGLAAGLRPNGPLSRSLDGYSILAFSMPDFWLGVLLILTFSVAIPILPSFGFVSPFVDPIEGFRRLIMPAFTLALSQSAVLASFVRSSVRRVRNEPYVIAARANGLPPRTIQRSFVLRNALIPVTTIAGLTLGRMLGGAIIVENVFGIPGLGRLLVSSISSRDYPVIQAILILLVVAFVLLNLITDLLYRVIDPRIRLT